MILSSQSLFECIGGQVSTCLLHRIVQGDETLCRDAQIIDDSGRLFELSLRKDQARPDGDV
jgi:hypothetical protein